MRVWTRLALTLTCLATAGVALAADDPIAERRKLMQQNGRAEDRINQLILGKFFPDKALAQLRVIQKNMGLFPGLFPVGSETGGETHAGPAIWQDMDDFRARSDELIAAAKGAEAAVANGQDAFAVAWQDVLPRCHACHDTYAPDFAQ